MGLPQTIDKRCRALEVHRTALLQEWRRHPTASKIAAGFAMLVTGIAGGLFIRRIGFGKVRKLYTYAMLVGRVKSQIQAQHLKQMHMGHRHPAGAAPRPAGSKTAGREPRPKTAH